MVAYVRRHLQGHIQYFGVSGNSRSLQEYVYQAGRLLFKWLNRRSQRRSVAWARFNQVVVPHLPRPRIIHDLWVANCQSGGNWCVEQTAAMLPPGVTTKRGRSR